MKKAEISSSCEKMFAGDAIVEPDVRDAAIAWVPDTMRFLDATTVDETDQVNDDQVDTVEPADDEVDDAVNDDETVDEPAGDDVIQDEQAAIAA